MSITSPLRVVVIQPTQVSEKTVSIPLNYRQVSNIRSTQSPNIDVSCLVLQLSLPNPLKPGVKLRMKM